MHAPKVGFRIGHAKAVALGLREAAGYCIEDQSALRARLLQAAQTIDELAALVEQTEFVARLNHNTIREMSR